MGFMRPLRVFGWAAVIAAVPVVLIVEWRPLTAHPRRQGGRPAPPGLPPQ